jgi:hypothetical protein
MRYDRQRSIKGSHVSIDVVSVHIWDRVIDRVAGHTEDCHTLDNV